MADHDNDDQTAAPKARTDAEQAAALESVTDMAEERELRVADTSKIQQAMAALAQQQMAQKEAQRKHERELMAVKIDSEDVMLIANEFELDKKEAERLLREHKGVLKDALEALLA